MSAKLTEKPVLSWQQFQNVSKITSLYWDHSYEQPCSHINPDKQSISHKLTEEMSYIVTRNKEYVTNIMTLMWLWKLTVALQVPEIMTLFFVKLTSFS